jgi:5'-deoxynucleotidase YfbR-like HD superfamily hydrolase
MSDASVFPPSADHLAPLARGWSVWRWAVLRAPGFPAAEVTRLAAPEAAEAADRFLDRGAPAAERQAARDAVTRGAAGVGAALRELAGGSRFREALAWQNRAALHGSIGALLRRAPGATDSETRRHERVAALYLQRYCVKNETIGFFGPVGWAELAATGPALQVLTGPTLLAERHVYFERWCIDALAEKLSDSRELRAGLAPRRMPALRLEGHTLHYGAGRRVELPGEFATVLAACDGRRPASGIARELVSSGGGFTSEEEILEALDELKARKLIAWGFDIPTSGAPHPERALRAALERLKESQARQEALRALDELEHARDAAAQAAGDAAAVDHALQGMEDAFTRLTGRPAQRKAGKIYAGRTLAYEDCRRGDSIRLGPELMARLAPPLSLVLQSARWFTHTIAEHYRSALLALHRQLVSASGSPRLGLGHFSQHLPELFPAGSDQPSIVTQAREELMSRWTRVLEPSAGERRVARTCHELSARANDLFAAPHPGWPTARYHSPDVLIAAASAQAFERGDYLVVLGELHAGLNTVVSPMFLKEHPSPEVLIRAREYDIPEPCVAPVWSAERSRADISSPARHDIDLENGAVRSWRPEKQVLEESELVVEERSGQVVIRSRDGARSFDAIAFLEQHLMAEAHGRFTLLPPAPHTPRITVDGVVLSREQWRLRSEDLPTEGTSWQDRFIAIRGWGRRLGLPRYLMVKLPHEPKPLYLDLMSPLYVDLFCRKAREAETLTLTEMLPSVDELWLVDGEGRRYTSELRFAAVDPKPWRAP